MNIYAVLASIPHNPHYINRYIRFIQECQFKNIDYEGIIEQHHVCPKANDMFPEYSCFNQNPWNNVKLTPRQHFIAHLLLYKAYPDINSVKVALFLMSTKNDKKINSRLYEKLRLDFRDTISESSKRRVKDGTHHLLGGAIQRKRVKDGTHNLLGGAIQRKRVEDGTHPWLDRERASKNSRKRVKDGTHNLLGGAIHRKIVEDGTHNLLNVVNCIDKKGFYVQVTREVYYNQSGKVDDWDYVHFNTKEAKRRKGIVSEHDIRIKQIREDFLNSGLSKKQYSLLHNINYSSLKRYLYGI